MQIFAPCGLAAAQMTLGLVPLYDGLHLGPKARVLAAQVKQLEVTVAIRVGEGGKVFGSVNTQQIADALKAAESVLLAKAPLDFFLVKISSF